MEPNPTMQDPPHHTGELPCHWCGAVWVPDGNGLNSRTMEHAEDCAYIKWANEP